MVVKIKELRFDKEGNLTLEGKIVNAKPASRPFALPIGRPYNTELADRELGMSVAGSRLSDEADSILRYAGPGSWLCEDVDAYVRGELYGSGDDERFVVVQAYKICEEQLK